MKRVSYMEMIFLDGNDACHTNVRAAMMTNAKTLAAFRSYRHLEVGKDEAEFLLDYYNRDGDLADTILLDAKGFEAISGEKRKSAAAYRKIDREYWAKARAEYATATPTETVGAL